MTKTQRYPIICECGHRGEVLWVDNGGSAGSICEEYYLDGFEGRLITITSTSDFPEDILDALMPKCPQCGATGKVGRA